ARPSRASTSMTADVTAGAADATTGAGAEESDGAEISKGRRSVPRTDIALVFVKQLLRELVAEIPRGVLYVIAGIAGVIALILITIISVNTLGFLEGRRNNQAINELQQKLGEVSGEIDKVNSSLQE